MIKAFKLGLLISLITLSPIVSQEDYTELTWDMMKELNYETGEVPESLQKLHHQMVEVAGFIVPLEQGEYLDTVTEFLLVPDPFACIHVPPPPPNQMILVTMHEEIPTDIDIDGVAIQGLLTIPTQDNNSDIVSFELYGYSAEETYVEFDDSFYEDEDFYMYYDD